MLLVEVVALLRAKCPIFGRRVAGTKSFIAAQAENASIGVPSAYVVPLYDTAPNPDNTYSQQITESFGIVVCVDNSAEKRDGKGMGALMTLTTAKQQLFGALLGWTSPNSPTMDGVFYQRGQHLLMNNALLWHQFGFCYKYYVQQDLAAIDDFVQLQQLIDGISYGVDTGKIKHILVHGGIKPVLDFGEIDKYCEVLSILTDEPAAVWVRRVAGPNDSPGYVSTGLDLKAPKPFVAGGDGLAGYDP